MSLRQKKWFVCLLGCHLAACGAVTEEDYGSQDNAQSNSIEMSNRLGANGFEITENGTNAEVINNGSAVQIDYWGVVYSPEDIHLTAVSDILPGGLAANVSQYGSANVRDVKIDLSKVVDEAGIACDGFDYSGGRATATGHGLNAAVEAQGTRHDYNNDGHLDNDTLAIEVDFDVQVPLARSDHEEANCVVMWYQFRSQGILFFNKPVFDGLYSGRQPSCYHPDDTLCGGNECVNTNTSAAHCGACDNACGAGAACVDGTCVSNGAQCKFRTLFGSETMYDSGDILNHCLCDNGTWVSQTGQYCKNWP